jgi:hypothetical protein
MITAIDTNILLDILLPDESSYEASVGKRRQPVSSRATGAFTESYFPL